MRKASAVAAAVLLVSATHAHAQIILDTGPGTVSQTVGPNYGYGSNVAASSTMQIGQFGLYGSTAGGTFKFVIFNGTGSSLLFQQAVQLGATNGLLLSNPFDFTFAAGQSYKLGILADPNSQYAPSYFTSAETFSQNGLNTLQGDPNFSNYASPQYAGEGCCTMGIQIRGIADVTPTPEPAGVALIATGLVGVVGAARRKRSACSAS